MMKTSTKGQYDGTVRTPNNEVNDANHGLQSDRIGILSLVVQRNGSSPQKIQGTKELNKDVANDNRTKTNH